MALSHVNDIDIEYEIQGEGEPLLVLMGMGVDLHGWEPAFLDGLRRRFQLILVSNRGTGTTEDPGGDLTVPLMADDAAALVRALRYERVHVFGHSMGARIAQEIAINHGDFVHGLVLASTAPGGERAVPPSQEIGERARALLSLTGDKQALEFFRVLVTPEFFARNPKAVEAHVERLRRWPMSAQTLARHMVAIQRFDTYARLPRIATPTLILHGDADLLIPVANAQILHERIAGSHLVVVPGTAHCFPWEVPERAADLVTWFLAELDERASPEPKRAESTAA